MNPALQRYIDAASGLTNLTAEKAERIAKALVRSGATASDQIQEVAEDLMQRQRRNREAAVGLVKRESQRAVRAMGLATQREVDALNRKVERLEQELRRVRGGAKKATAKKATAKKATAKKATAKKATAKKATAKKATAKKASGGSSRS